MQRRHFLSGLFGVGVIGASRVTAAPVADTHQIGPWRVTWKAYVRPVDQLTEIGAWMAQRDEGEVMVASTTGCLQCLSSPFYAFDVRAEPGWSALPADDAERATLKARAYAVLVDALHVYPDRWIP